MALIGNYTNQNRLGCLYFGGTIANKADGSVLKVSNRKNQYLGGVSRLASIPYGAHPPYSIILAPVSGGMASRNEATGTLSGGVYLALGKGFTASSSAEISGAASFQVTLPITASSSSDISGSVTLSSTNSFSASGSGALSGQISVGSINSFTASGSASLSGSLTPRQLYYIVASGGVSSTLSPENLVYQMWAAQASENNLAGSMGEKLNDAGSSSNPWTEVITDGGYTAAELMRMFAAVLGGKSTVTFLGGVTYQVTFESVDQDEKIVVDATVVNSERTDLTLDLSE